MTIVQQFTEVASSVRSSVLAHVQLSAAKHAFHVNGRMTPSHVQDAFAAGSAHLGNALVAIQDAEIHAAKASTFHVQAALSALYTQLARVNAHVGSLAEGGVVQGRRGAIELNRITRDLTSGVQQQLRYAASDAVSEAASNFSHRNVA